MWLSLAVSRTYPAVLIDGPQPLHGNISYVAPSEEDLSWKEHTHAHTRTYTHTPTHTHVHTHTHKKIYLSQSFLINNCTFYIVKLNHN